MISVFCCCWDHSSLSCCLPSLPATTPWHPPEEEECISFSVSSSCLPFLEEMLSGVLPAWPPRSLYQCPLASNSPLWMLFFTHSLELLQQLCPRRKGQKYQGVQLFGRRWTAFLLQIGMIICSPESFWGLRQHVPCARTVWDMHCLLYVLPLHCCYFSGNISLANYFLMSPPLRNWPSPPPSLKHLTPTPSLPWL